MYALNILPNHFNAVLAIFSAPKSGWGGGEGVPSKLSVGGLHPPCHPTPSPMNKKGIGASHYPSRFTIFSHKTTWQERFFAFWQLRGIC